MLVIALYFVFRFTGSDLVVVDQITLPIPLLRLFKHKVLYYCHFPEALLNDNKLTKLVRAYRFVLDTIEVICLYFASILCFNSNYTKDNVEQVFPSVKKRTIGKYTVYPCMQNPPPLFDASISLPEHFMLSLNRFETRKRIDIAVKGFADALLKNPKLKSSTMKLILAGGLDAKNKDAIVCRSQLEQLAKDQGISDRVIFMENINEIQKEALLRYSSYKHRQAFIFLYTPPNEHFGIGPIESMIRGVPALGINNGGPKETIENEKTGYLLSIETESWSRAINTLVILT
jgi:alpha-1,3/alpha-1,6-mannosyltransferase